MITRLKIVAISCALFTNAANADIKTAIIRNFQANSDFFVINLPPRPDAWPGAIFTSNLRFPIIHGNSKDPALHSGPPIKINTDDGLDINAGAKVGVSSIFGISSDATDVAQAVMSFPDAHIVDMDYGDLVRRVEASTDAINAAKRGQIPVIIVKSYVGTPLITVTKKADASAEAWAKLKRNVEAGVKAAASNENSISYQSDAPFVFAFETSEIHFDPSDLNKGKLTIQLASLPELLFAYRDNESYNQLAATIRATTGISVKDIENQGILGGDHGGTAAIIRAIGPLKFKF